MLAPATLRARLIAALVALSLLVAATPFAAALPDVPDGNGEEKDDEDPWDLVNAVYKDVRYIAGQAWPVVTLALKVILKCVENRDHC